MFIIFLHVGDAPFSPGAGVTGGPRHVRDIYAPTSPELVVSFALIAPVFQLC